ncbi:hypothetical protein IFM89_015968 [Coptis chinensis]|uniref:Uncharacterized protein n=1 Tax=Coptis chinensis TaxID=261450 RepID=A0A835HEU7_9MAGN|nr:hypothetical protein IFM89_015968 [Coptis chinensis]
MKLIQILIVTVVLILARVMELCIDMHEVLMMAAMHEVLTMAAGGGRYFIRGTLMTPDFSGNNYFALWPGDGKPGLWMNSISRMGALYALIAREEEIFIEERKRAGGESSEIEMNKL